MNVKWLLSGHASKMKDNKIGNKIKNITNTISKIISKLSTFVWEDSIPSLASKYNVSIMQPQQLQFVSHSDHIIINNNRTTYKVDNNSNNMGKPKGAFVQLSCSNWPIFEICYKFDKDGKIIAELRQVISNDNLDTKTDTKQDNDKHHTNDNDDKKFQDFFDNQVYHKIEKTKHDNKLKFNCKPCFINDKLYVIVNGKTIQFFKVYCVKCVAFGNKLNKECKIDPKYKICKHECIYEYKIQNSNVNNQNSICLLEYRKINDWNEEYFLSFLLLGGENNPFYKSFLQFNTTIKNNSQIDKINECKIKDIKTMCTFDFTSLCWGNVNCHCVVDSNKNEQIVLITGGKIVNIDGSGPVGLIGLYNCQKNALMILVNSPSLYNSSMIYNVRAESELILEQYRQNIRQSGLIRVLNIPLLIVESIVDFIDGYVYVLFVLHIL